MIHPVATVRPPEVAQAHRRPVASRPATGRTVAGRPISGSRARRRTVLAAAAAVPVAGALVACSREEPRSQDAQQQVDEVTLLTSFGLLGRDSYAHVALEHGFFADAGMEVTIEPGSGANPNVQALLAGQAQFAVADFSGAIIAAGQGMTGVVALAAVQQLPLAALMAVDEQITVPADISGRRVGLPAGAATDLLFDAWAAQAGVQDVQRVEMGPQDLVAALVSGQVDAIGQFVVGLPLVQAAAGDRTVTVLPYSDFLTDMYGIALLTTAELAAQDPDLCGRFRDALLLGLDYAIGNPQRAGQALSGHNPSADAEVAAEEVRLMAPYVDPGTQALGHMSETKVARSVALMQSLGAIEDWVGPAGLVAFDLVPGAEA